MLSEKSVTDQGLEELARNLFIYNVISDFNDLSGVRDLLTRRGISLVEEKGDCIGIVRKGELEQKVTMHWIEKELVGYYRSLSQKPQPVVEKREADLDQKPETSRTGPKDELPEGRVLVRARPNKYVPPERTVNRLTQRSTLYLWLGVVSSILSAGILGALLGYQAGEYSGRNKTQEEVHQNFRKKSGLKIKLSEGDNQDLFQQLTSCSEELKHAYDNNAHLGSKVVSAEGDYAECFTDLMNIGVALADSNSSLEQCNSASELGKRDYAELEIRLDEFSRESRAKIDFLVNQSSSWYNSLSVAVTLWLNAEERYADSLEAGRICELSWESEKQDHLNHSREWSFAYEEREKIEEELTQTKKALAQAVEINAYQAEQFAGLFRDDVAIGRLEDIKRLEEKSNSLLFALEENKRESSEARARAEECAGERDSCFNFWENERALALTYVENGLAAVAERDRIVLELADSLAQEQAIDQTNAELAALYTASEVIANGALGDLIKTQENLVQKTTEYDALKIKSAQEIKELQEQIARVQEQLKIAERESYVYDQERDAKGLNLTTCRAELGKLEEKLSRASQLLDGKIYEYDSLVHSFSEERKKAQEQLVQVEEQLKAEREKTGEGYASEDENSRGYCTERWVGSAVQERQEANYQTGSPEIIFLAREEEQEVFMGQRPAEKYSASESDLPVREVSYYGQLKADPTQSVKVAVAFVEERGSSVNVCGNNCRAKLSSLYEQIVPEGRDDIYTLEFFVKETSGFCRGMSPNTPYCVPLSVIGE